MNNILNYKDIVLRIRKELETYIKKNDLQSLVLGISGGIDSALCAALARPVCDKLHIPLIGRSIPITTNTYDERDRAGLVGDIFCTNFDEAYQVEWPYKEVWNMVKLEAIDVEDSKEKIRKGNIKARIRMIYLYDLAQLHNGLVLSTDNYTEYLLGFWTLHGDVGDYGMLQNLWKTEVYDMSEYLATTLPKEKAKILQSCIDCQATDGLGISETDLEQIMPNWKGSSKEGYSKEGYSKVDKILFSYLIGVKKYENELMKDLPVIKRHLATKYKRNNPFNIPRNFIILKD